MVKLFNSFSRLQSPHVLIIGDFMLDTYTTGHVERISPEAPVPILHVEKIEDRPGGAGNVALNLIALGAKVMAVGRIGDDRQGLHLKKLLKKKGIDPVALFIQHGITTPLKNRFIGNGQQLIRVDQESKIPLTSKIEEMALAYIHAKIDQVKVIAFSDYGKGFLSKSILQTVIDLATTKGIPTIIDPKGEDFSKYQGATVIKPNDKEALLASNLSTSASLDAIGNSLLTQTGSKMVIITRSEKGISLFKKNHTRLDFPVKCQEVKDVTGAGDTVLAMITLSCASGLSIEEGLELSNIAAGIAIERLGCVDVCLSTIAQRILEINMTHKIFDQNHLFALERALERKNLTILGVNTEKVILNHLFLHIQKLSQQSLDEKLMIYFINPNPDEDILSLLSSFDEVDFILIHSDSLTSFTKRIRPSKVYLLNNDGTLTNLSQHPQALLL